MKSYLLERNNKIMGIIIIVLMIIAGSILIHDCSKSRGQSNCKKVIIEQIYGEDTSIKDVYFIQTYVYICDYLGNKQSTEWESIVRYKKVNNVDPQYLMGQELEKAQLVKEGAENQVDVCKE